MILPSRWYPSYIVNFLKKGLQDFFQTQDLRYSNAVLKKLGKAFCLKIFSFQGTAQDRCVQDLKIFVQVRHAQNYFFLETFFVEHSPVDLQLN